MQQSETPAFTGVKGPKGRTKDKRRGGEGVVSLSLLCLPPPSTHTPPHLERTVGSRSTVTYFLSPGGVWRSERRKGEHAGQFHAREGARAAAAAAASSKHTQSSTAQQTTLAGSERERGACQAGRAGAATAAATAAAAAASALIKGHPQNKGELIGRPAPRLAEAQQVTVFCISLSSLFPQPPLPHSSTIFSAF